MLKKLIIDDNGNIYFDGNEVNSKLGIKNTKDKKITLPEMYKHVKIISAFPGTGKTYFYEQNKDIGNISDSDSSQFNKARFPHNYFVHLLFQSYSKNILLVSSHKEVRDILIKNEISFDLVYPDMWLKSLYLDRYRERGSSDDFIAMIDLNWTKWIEEIMEIDSPYVNHVVLRYHNEYLSDHYTILR